MVPLCYVWFSCTGPRRDDKCRGGVISPQIGQTRRNPRGPPGFWLSSASFVVGDIRRLLLSPQSDQNPDGRTHAGFRMASEFSRRHLIQNPSESAQQHALPASLAFHGPCIRATFGQLCRKGEQTARPMVRRVVFDGYSENSDKKFFSGYRCRIDYAERSGKDTACFSGGWF